MPGQIDDPHYDRRGLRNILAAARITESIVQWMVLLGPVHMHELSPELTLSMAAIERTLFSYIETLRLHTGGTKAGSCHPSSVTPAVTSGTFFLFPTPRTRISITRTPPSPPSPLGYAPRHRRGSGEGAPDD